MVELELRGGSVPNLSRSRFSEGDLQVNQQAHFRPGHIWGAAEVQKRGGSLSLVGEFLGEERAS